MKPEVILTVVGEVGLCCGGEWGGGPPSQSRAVVPIAHDRMVSIQTRVVFPSLERNFKGSHAYYNAACPGKNETGSLNRDDF